MKLMFASDLHGSEYYTKKLVEKYNEFKCEKMVLLGDILYHGPRNDLPFGYNPKGVIELLNNMSKDIVAVRGNCEAEVDQMVLDFNCMSDSLLMWERGRKFFITHGHIYNKDNLPKLNDGDILLHGHTHVKTIEKIGEMLYINPGSVSIPKENNPPSFMIYEDGRFTIYDFDLNILDEVTI